MRKFLIFLLFSLIFAKVTLAAEICCEARCTARITPDVGEPYEVSYDYVNWVETMTFCNVDIICYSVNRPPSSVLVSDPDKTWARATSTELCKKLFPQPTPSPTPSILGPIVQCTSVPCSWQDFVVSFQNLIRIIVVISFIIALLMSVIGAFLLMLHGPFPNLYARGKDLIRTAIIGYILILIAGIVFDIILDFFGPIKLRPTTSIVFAAFEPGSGGGGIEDSSPDIFIYYNFIKDSLMSGLRCGKEAKSPLDRLFKCIFEVLNLLKNFALILLGAAIIASAIYLITTPLFGLKQIPRAWNILVWSIIGFVIILLADLIRDQIIRILK